MPRPTIADDVLDRLEEAVDRRTNVPTDVLTTSQRVGVALDRLEEADARIDRLADRVDELETQLEAARAESAADPAPEGGAVDLGGVDGLNFNQQSNFNRGR